jgi:tetratricopeptide (TPR) repeat protein
MSTYRIFILMLGSMLAAGSVFAQPAPPRPFAPVRPTPPAPPAPPALNWDFPVDFDLAFGPAFQDQLAQIRVNADQIRAQAEQFRFSGRGPRRGDDGLYLSGQRALDRGQWDEALANFNRVVSNAGPRAEGALYWKAYTLSKLGRRDEARAAIADLRKTYPMSHWLDDANALDMEIQQAAGQNVSPENQTDEELKLMAVNALVRTDPDRAFPLLENLLKSAQTPRLKQRALFVLSQTDAPRAQQLLEQVARGGGNPDLQVTAITYLGATSRRKGNTQPLYDIYMASNDTNVKRAILQSLRSADDTDHILQAVKAEKNAELRAEGIRMLGSKTNAADALVGIWGTEQDQQVKYAILDSLNAERDAKALVDLARKERDAQMKKEIVRRLSNMQSKEATDYLMELLK